MDWDRQTTSGVDDWVAKYNQSQGYATQPTAAPASQNTTQNWVDQINLQQLGYIPARDNPAVTPGGGTDALDNWVSQPAKPTYGGLMSTNPNLTPEAGQRALRYDWLSTGDFGQYGGKAQSADVSDPGKMNAWLQQVNAGDVGSYRSGLEAIAAGWNPYTAATGWDTDRLKAIAQGYGFDLTPYDLSGQSDFDKQVEQGQGVGGYYRAAQNAGQGIIGAAQALDKHLSPYYAVNALSNSWNPGINERVRNNVLYKIENGTANPIFDIDQDVARERSDRYRVARMAGLGLAGVLTGGLAMGAVGGAGAAGAAGAGGAGTTAAGAGTAAAGAGAGATGGIGGTLANALGLGSQWASLPGWAQAAVMGAGQGGITSGLSGGNVLKGMLTGAITGGAGSAISPAISGLGLGQTATGALTGAAQGGLSSAIGGGNPLTGALLGGLGGGASGAANQFGGIKGGLANTIGSAVKQGAGGYLKDQIQDEIFQGRQDLMNGVYQEAAQRGISPQQLNQFMQTPQGRQAVQALIQQQGKGTLQSLFG